MMHNKKIIQYLFIFLIVIFTVQTSAKVSDAKIKKHSKAPAIMLRNMKRDLVFVMDHLKKKPVLISFFFVGCKPCEKEIPELEKLNKQYKNKIKMFLISTDAKGSSVVKPYIKEKNIHIDVLLDKYSKVAKTYNVSAFPSVFIIGKDGRVKYSCIGYKKKNIKKIKAYLKKLK